MAESNSYLTEAQFAERFHLGRRTVQRWRQTGEGPAWVRLGHRRILYRLTDIEHWAEARTFRHRADELSRKAMVGAAGAGIDDYHPRDRR